MPRDFWPYTGIAQVDTPVAYHALQIKGSLHTLFLPGYAAHLLEIAGYAQWSGLITTHTHTHTPTHTRANTRDNTLTRGVKDQIVYVLLTRQVRSP